MGAPKMTLEEAQHFAASWIELVERKGIKVADFADHMRLSERNVYLVRDRVQIMLGVVLSVKGDRARAPDLLPIMDHTTLEGEWHALIGSDWHIWPGYHSRAEEAFLATLQADTFDAVILNGDITDQPRVSRHDPLQGIQPPSLVDELSEAKGRLDEIANAGDCGAV